MSRWSLWYSGDKTTSDYLQTPKGQLGRHSWRRVHGLQRFRFASEPKSKNGMSRQEKLDFQRHIYAHMRKYHRRAYRGRVCAQFSMDPTENNPPHIHTATKNLVDLFGRPLDGSGLERKGLIYGDDRQIAYLAATYNLGNTEPCIRVGFYPFRYFVADLELASNILAGTYDDDRLPWDRRLSESTNDDLDDLELDSDFEEWTKNREATVRLVGANVYNAMVQYYMFRHQERFLRLSGLRIKDINILYRSVGLTQEKVRFEHLSQWAQSMSKSLGRWVIDSPLKIRLPQLPMSEGETNEFKSAIRNELRAFKVKHPLLQRLQWPVGLELLYKPPVSSRGFQKDLDNIARLIVPVFNEEFRPPPSFFSSINDIPDLLDGRKREQLRALPKSVRYSVVRYEVFEVPRSAFDDQEGFLCLGVTGGNHCYRTMWDRVEGVIHDWREQVRRF